MSTTFDDIPFGVETGRAASYTDWQIETRDRSEMVPYSNILITEHIGYAPAQVTWRLHFYRRDDYFAFLAKLRTVGTLKVHAGLQSLKGTQVTLGAFLATFVYSVLVLLAIESGAHDGGPAPDPAAASARSQSVRLSGVWAS